MHGAVPVQHFWSLGRLASFAWTGVWEDLMVYEVSSTTDVRTAAKGIQENGGQNRCLGAG